MKTSVIANADLCALARRITEVSRTAAIIAASEEFGGKWCESITVARVDFDCAVSQGYQVCICPSRVKEVGELVRIDWDFLGSATGLDELTNLVCLEIAPFIIGVGDVTADKSPEVGIVIRRDQRKNFNVHDVSSTAESASPRA
jgi:hypothetical protein